MSERSVPVPRVAATVMLLRDRGGVEVYLARRAAGSRFMPGAFVFPGGALDAADASPATLACVYGASAEPQLAVAAARELFEEAGILLACNRDGVPVRHLPKAARELRETLRSGADFAGSLTSAGLSIDVRPLVPYSRWITPIHEPIRFDTHFFLARLPEGQEPEADARELHDGVWSTPSAALRSAETGEMTIVFPTLKHLERLAAFPDVGSAVEQARARTVRPVLVETDASGNFRLPGGATEW